MLLQVISSLIPNDDFGGFEPLRQQVSVSSATVMNLLSLRPGLSRLSVLSTEAGFL